MAKNRDSLLKRFLIWRIRHISNRQFLNILSLVVGIVAGLVAAIIKNSVHFIQNLLEQGIAEEYLKYLYFGLPTVGLILCLIFIKYIIKQPVRHGIPNVLYSLGRNKGYMKPHNTYSSIITSAFTVGFGGSVGLEGPTVATGGAYGSVLSKGLHLDYKQTVLLLGAASVGAMSAIFKAPIAAIVFGLEVIMLDLTMASLIPLLLASASATLTSYLMLGMDVLYPFNVQHGFTMGEVPYYIAIGIVGGFAAVYFTHAYLLVEKLFDKIKTFQSKVIVGGISLGVLIFFFPALYGEGYSSINMGLSGDMSYLYEKSLFAGMSDQFLVTAALLLGLILFKVVATSITFGAGGVGGIFAPTLFTGVNLGLLFTLVVSQLGLANLPENNFALIGMGAMISAVLHAPLTAIFLIGDITGGYELVFPLMITATISYATVRAFTLQSVYTYQLAQRKELLTHDKDKTILSLMNIENLIEKNFSQVCPRDTLGDLVKVISKSKRNIFPVTDENNRFLGMVVMDDIREIMFRPKMYDKVNVSELMFTPETVVDINDSMEEVANKFRSSGNYNLPVLDNGKYVGFVSRARVFSTYRSMLKQFSED
ncbi:MAG: chloride channel protein [Bacteroidales bacterium]|nr:chloride channel protein [Bacteroidales bacterium]MCF8339115.1 chloride channel protein [Bacteroidales bacterium]